MKQGIKIENGYIYLALNENELVSVLEDMVDCGDLLSPHIVIEENYARFRDEDVKMMQPELFFIREEPKLRINEQVRNRFIVSNVLVFSSFLGIYYWVTGGIGIGHWWLVLASIMVMMNLCYFFYLKSEHRERHRKAIYLKARLLTYFYMVVNLDVTNCNERLTRTVHRQESEYLSVKHMHQHLLSLQPDSFREDYRGEKYPDGDYVLDPDERIQTRKRS